MKRVNRILNDLASEVGAEHARRKLEDNNRKLYIKTRFSKVCYAGMKHSDWLKEVT